MCIFCVPAVIVAFLAFNILVAHADTYAFVPQRDGTITRYRIDTRTGRLILLPGTTQTQIHRSVSLVLSTNKRFLYVYRIFDLEKDGFLLDFLGNKATVLAAHTKPTPIIVFAIGRNGGLRQVQTLSVPGPVGQMLPHPSGRFAYALTEEGAFLLKTESGAGERAGWLTYVGRVTLNSGLFTLNSHHDRSEWWLTFSASGKYLYNFRGTGFGGDHSENYTQLYRINPTTGQATEDGPEWSDRYGSAENRFAKACEVYFFVGKTVFMAGFATGCGVWRTDEAGRISGNRSTFWLSPKNSRANHDKQTLVKHPTLPTIVYRGSFAEPYTIWRVTAPGKLVKASVFSSAFGTASAHGIAIDASGRFLYETATPDSLVKAPLVAVFSLSKDGRRAKSVVPPAPLPFGSDTTMILVSIPPAK